MTDTKGQAMKSRKLLSLGAAVSLLAACGGGGSDSGEPPPTLTSASASSGVRYSEVLLLTLRGTRLDQALTLESTGCKNFARSTAAPFVSTATTAYFSCTVSGAVGSLSVNVSGGGASLGVIPFSVDLPQVTFTISNGGNLNGTLLITLRPDAAPRTVDNFLAYVKGGFYDATAIHRHARNENLSSFVLQGGAYAAPVSSTARFPTHKTTLANIALEVGRGLSNVRYSLAMARGTELDSANSEFFINTANNAFLDTQSGGYAVFGTVVTGTTLVDAMVAAPCNFSNNFALGSNDCVPEPNLVISSAAQTR